MRFCLKTIGSYTVKDFILKMAKYDDTSKNSNLIFEQIDDFMK